MVMSFVDIYNQVRAYHPLGSGGVVDEFPLDNCVNVVSGGQFRGP